MPCFANTISGDPGSPLLCTADPTTNHFIQLTPVPGAPVPTQLANHDNPAAPVWFLTLSDGRHCHYLGYGTTTAALPYDCGGGLAATAPDRTAPMWTVTEAPFTTAAPGTVTIAVLTAVA